VVQQHETDARRQLAEGVGEVALLLSLVLHQPVPHSLRNQESCLVEIPGLESDCQWSIFLVVLGLDVDVLVQ
jgi:hypothetical protein